MANVSYAFEQVRKDKNAEWHLQEITDAVAFLMHWPCITAISNIRLALDAYERDIKNGDASVAERRRP